MVGAVVKGVDGKTHQEEAGRTGRIIYFPSRLPSSRSAWIEDVQKKRTSAVS